MRNEYHELRSEIFNYQIKEIINQLEEIEELIEDKNKDFKNRVWNFVLSTINEEINILRD